MISLFLTAAALLIGLDRSAIGPKWSRPFSSRSQTIAADLAQYDGRQFPVVRVVDGDTLHLAVPDGPDRTTKVRLLGIDAAEMGDGRTEPMYFAREATAFVRQVALERVVTVHLDEKAGSRDRYGRLLAYVELPDGRFLNEELLRGGYVYADLRFRHSYFQKYKQLEASARSLKEGLWAHVRPEQMPAWRRDRLAESASQQ